ncbi:hypothetical protein FJT64_006546 [Amphibalanus amphitrite]|uniref:Uncharacterized protein n=1 Tax=Amphibalanus amphitrite TaxID=1232801 RepID=A0A6A4W2A0_AMPAM|nr:hypothetical protein FJT64_006546 [Amphibalanus amphitrite]
MECIKDPAFLTLLREEVMAPIIKSLVSEAIAERDSEIAELRQEPREVRSELNALQQYSRRSCLNISGIPESENESTDRVVRDVAAAAGVTLGPTDIDCSHRLGRQQDGKCRTIIVKMSSHSSRDALYAARKNLRSARSSAFGPEILKGIFIAENLTKANQQVMYAARQLKKRGKIHSAWTDNCRMKIRLQANGPTRVIRSLEDLREQVGDAPEFNIPAASTRLGADGDPPEPLTPAAEAGPDRDPDGYQRAGARGSARGGARRNRTGGRR